MCGINMRHVKEQHIKTGSVLEQLGLRSVGIYMAKRRLRAVAWPRPEDGLEQATEEAALVVGLSDTSTRAAAEIWAESIEDDIKTAGLTFSNWHEKANEENKSECGMEKQN
jgi:hypothetical protein